MKKIYINPDLKIVKIQTAKMIAVSIDVYGKNANSAGMSRGGNDLWDDDEEDDY